MKHETKYENFSDEIDKLIERHRSSWFLYAVPSISYDDISQEIRLHIFKKLHLYNPELPFTNWCSVLISNRIINLLRDNYSGFAKPCTSCALATGDNGCLYEGNPTKKQCSICPLYRDWEKRRKAKHDVKLPVSAEFHQPEISSITSDHVDLEKYFKLVNKKARKHLTKVEYLIYRMLYVQKKTEEDVAKALNLRTSEKNRRAGYRQLATHKARIFEKIKKLIEKEDIISHG